MQLAIDLILAAGAAWGLLIAGLTLGLNAAAEFRDR